MFGYSVVKHPFLGVGVCNIFSCHTSRSLASTGDSWTVVRGEVGAAFGFIGWANAEKDNKIPDIEIATRGKSRTEWLRNILFHRDNFALLFSILQILFLALPVL
jgi:hypothetical protein